MQKTRTPICFARGRHLNVHFELIVVSHADSTNAASCVCCLVVLRTFYGHVSGCLALPEPKNYISATSVHHALRLMQVEAPGPASQEFYSGL